MEVLSISSGWITDNIGVRFCSQDFAWRKTANRMPLRLAIENIYLAYRRGYRRLGFTGGEPTLRKELPSLIRLAVKIGYRYIRLQTNGLRLADPAYAKSLADAGLSFVKFSIHGHTAEVHDSLTMVPGSYEACLKAMRNLRRLNIGVGVNLVLNKRNYRHLREIYEKLLVELEVSDHVLIAPLYEGNMARHAEEMGVRLSDAAPYIRKVYELFVESRFPKPPLLLHFTPCVLPS